MEQLLEALRGLGEVRALAQAAGAGRPAALTGAAQINRSHIIAALYRMLDRPMVVLCQDDLAADRTAAELKSFLGEPVPVLPGRDLTLYDSSAVSRGWEQKRLRQLYLLGSGANRLQVLSMDAATLRTIPRQVLLSASFTLQQGDTCDLQVLARRLTDLGYTQSNLVEGPGQFALRGGILDVFSPAHEQPVRAEFFGDEIDAMGYFDSNTQRRTENCTHAVLLPVAEALPRLHPAGVEGLCQDLEALIERQKRRRNVNAPLLQTLQTDLEKLRGGVSFPAADRYLSLIYPQAVSAMDYLSDETVVVLCDHGNLQRAVRQRTEELGLQLDGLLQTGTLAGELCDFSLQWEAFVASLERCSVLYLDAFLSADYPEQLRPQQLLNITAKQLPSYGGNLETAAADLEYYQKHEFGAVVLCANRRRGEILQQALQEKGRSAFLAFPLRCLPAPGQILITEGSLPNGMEYPALHLAVLTEGQLLRPARRRMRAPKRSQPTNRQKLNSFTDLTPGDLVVHEYHGIGRYVGMEQMKLDGVVKDYVKISYQGTDTLYVPATQLDLVSKYIGGGENAPVKLNRLSGDAWEKTKARAKKAAKDMAGELIQLYAQRRRQPGYAFSADTPWQQEFEDSFEFAETDDQLRCAAEIKGDMEAAVPMDRLLCGDVGFGKTEVALRAAMKAMLDGKQVAILVPTTVLAQQHFVTAKKRFTGFPVNIDVLSRFRTQAMQRKTLAGLEAGSVDLVIGTHKLLNRDIRFKALGLLIVDEEQRFGVSHKERLKELSRGVDVLTLSATPIPRTLNMALSGLRDMSTIEQPPQDRYPVQTFVMEYAEPVLDDAMRRELERGGQIYYLHNRVESIEQCAAQILRRLPGVSVAVAHGKMNEEQLGEVMQRMADGEIQILVCTTIIETGIDIPNVNTLIIEDADHLGLAQLHQLRGRVGRSNRHAFAYLTFRRGKVLSEVAEKRLNAIRDFAEFGSGFKIAMRDLEIRGAGNLLGAEQSGHMISVGYDMYLKLLEDAVLEERGETKQRALECTADLAVSASIDRNYVENSEQRMDLYRRMAAVRSQQDADDLLDEIVDRYGDPPKGVMNLLAVALLRAKAAQAGITDISQKAGSVAFTMLVFHFEAISAICATDTYRGRVYCAPNSDRPIVSVKLLKGENVLQVCEDFVGKYQDLTAVPEAGETGNTM